MPAFPIKLTDQDMLYRESQKDQARFWTDTSTKGMVASAHYRATWAGASVLKRGGNAMDAAIACSLALGVCEPAESGLGGMAMMLVHWKETNRTFVLEGACRAPELATPQAIAECLSRYRGLGAVAIPGCPALLGYAQKKYGILKLAEVIAPAQEIAEQGYLITSFQTQMIKNHRYRLAKENGGSLYLDPDGNALEVGHRLRNPALAKTLGRLAQHGFEDFYQGFIARQIADQMEKQGGFVRLRDLEKFPLPEENEPVWGKYGHWDVATLGPPGGGLALLQMLHLYDKLKIKEPKLESPEDYVLLAKIIQRARKDRRRFRKKIPMRFEGGKSEFLKSSYAKDALKKINQSSSKKSGETSHFSVMDQWGNVVAMTQSIERLFGAKVIHPELGFLYNGYLKTFKIQSKTHPHWLRPGALARSNAAPTILFEKKSPYAALGSTGSERIVSSLLQVILRLRYQTGFEALQAPRLHCSPEGDVFLEIERIPAGTPRALVENGFRLNPLESYSHIMGGIHLVEHKGEKFVGSAEPRRDGASAGPEKVE
jgi:gamma-glutamyltranspeptidase/glutathione hydrolase